MLDGLVLARGAEAVEGPQALCTLTAPTPLDDAALRAEGWRWVVPLRAGDVTRGAVLLGPPAFAAALTASSAVIGPIIPPSIPVVIYALVSDASIGYLFLAGVVPGLVMLSVMTQAISNASFGIYFPKFIGTIYELLSAPINCSAALRPRGSSGNQRGEPPNMTRKLTAMRGPRTSI